MKRLLSPTQKAALSATAMVGWFLAMLLVVALHGCTPAPKPEPISTAELLTPQLKAITDRLDAIDAKLDKIAKRRIIFPSLGDKPEMAKDEGYGAMLNTTCPYCHKQFFVPYMASKGAAAPDIRAAVGHSLMAAADLCGRDKVVGFFRDMVGEIVSKRIPIDVGGAVKAKCQADATEKINSLLTQ